MKNKAISKFIPWLILMIACGLFLGKVIRTEGKVVDEIVYIYEDLTGAIASRSGHSNQDEKPEEDIEESDPSPMPKPDEREIDVEPVSFEREPYFPLENCAHSRLYVGDRAIVSLGGGANGIRTEPDTHPSDNIIYRAPSGEGLWIIDGPVCNYGWILWKVETDTGYVGWTPESPGDEFWLTPIESESDMLADIKEDPVAYEAYEKVNSTMQDPTLTEEEKKEKVRHYQDTYGKEVITTVIRYVPVYEGDGEFTSFDSWMNDFTEELGDSDSGDTPFEEDPVGSAMDIFFDPSEENITEQLGLDDW